MMDRTGRKAWKNIPNGWFNEKDELITMLSKQHFTGSARYCNVFYCSKCFKRYFLPWMLKRHVEKCTPKFNNIIFEQNDLSIAYINIDGSPRERLVCERISRISKVESGWDFPILHRDNWYAAEIKSHVFLMLMAGSIVSLVLFREKLTEKAKFCLEIDFPDENTRTKTTARYACGDIFTVHDYRRKGYAKFLLQKALEYLGETPEFIAFLVPFTEKGYAFIQSLKLSRIRLCRS